MVFTTTKLFKGIQCPQGEKCDLTNCIFAHDLRPQKEQAAPPAQPEPPSLEGSDDPEPAAKRRRVTYEKAEDKPPSKADLIRIQLSKERSSKDAPSANGNAKPASTLSTLKRSVSPPTTTNDAKSSSLTSTQPKSSVKNGAGRQEHAAPETPLSLNPRLLPNDPAGHAKRSLYLKYMHAEMARLNQQIKDRKDVQYKPALILSESEVIKAALDEEETLAREQGAVYANVVKNRIATYKKMKVDDWISHLKITPTFVGKQAAAKKSPNGPKLDKPMVIDTGLQPDEELAVLQHLVVKNQKPLAQHGYIIEPPSAEAAAEAAAAVAMSANFEICDRCAARFQIYPNRNEEGLLTSNGKCRYHPYRVTYPQRSKADTGPKEAYHPCCNGLVGSLGCTVSDHHVFKASSPARLAAVMPFTKTPENDKPNMSGKGQAVGAVAFDCEMGYTTMGMEVIRLTAVSWPDGEQLIDVLVRPIGIVLDLNTRFSGIRPEDMTNGIPLTPGMPPVKLEADSTDGTAPPPLPIVGSPAAARDLLCSYITPSIPLIGHAIDNDLNVIRLCHPNIVDTVLLYPHRRGLPLRHGLRALSSQYLRRTIQQGGERGHDSLEDARATGDLVRVKIGEKWKLLRASGWKFEQGKLVPPERGGVDTGENSADSNVMDAAMNGGKKRKRSSDAEAKPAGLVHNEAVGGEEGARDEHVLSVNYLEGEAANT